jgi:hypothetical protein
MTLHILQASPATASIQVNTSSGVELSAQRSGAGRAGEAPPDRAPNELTRWWRKRDSKRRSLSQNTSVCFRGRVWPKGRPEWLEPSHHLSGTDSSNTPSSSGESDELPPEQARFRRISRLSTIGISGRPRRPSSTTGQDEAKFHGCTSGWN